MAEDVPPPQDRSSLSFLRDRSSLFNQIANDARSLIKTNLLIIGLFLPIIASLFSGQLSPEKVFNNAYTQVGLFVWIISTLILTFSHQRARTAGKSHFDPVEDEILGNIPYEEQIYHIQDTIAKYRNSVRNLNLLVTFCMVLSLIATTLFALGVLLPYVSFIPQTGAVVVIVSIIGISLSISIIYLLIGRLPKLSNYFPRQENAWEGLTRPRKDLLKKIYVAVGDASFQLSDLPLKSEEDNIPGTFPTNSLDDSHVLLRDVGDTEISKYLLDQLVEEGYFEITEENDTIKIISPYSLEKVPISEAEDEVDTAIDRLGRELEYNQEARETAASELRVRPSAVMDELQSGEIFEKIQLYNRVIERLEDEEYDISASEFIHSSDGITYTPTKLAKEAFEVIEYEKMDREYKREMAKRDEEIRKAENTHRFEVVEPVDEFGKIQVVGNDAFAPQLGHKWLNIDEAKVSEKEREQLRNLESGENIQLRIERFNRPNGGGDEYIASVGGP